MQTASDRHRDRPPPAQRQTRRAHLGGDPPMQLTQILDLNETSALKGQTIPCRENDAELWFADTPDGVEGAKALCGSCPARQACLLGALQRREPWGVWGGELFVHGETVARKRPRGRPRKSEVAA